MQHSFKIAAAAALCATTFAAHAELSMDANLELDTTYQSKVSKPATNARDSDLNMGGRVEFNVGAKATNGDSFVQARGTLLVKKDGDTAVDDMWVQFGNAGMDVKMGRFEAMDLFPVGKDTYVENSGYGGYHANALRGRFGKDTVHIAPGFNAGPARIEVGFVYSKEKGEVRGLRPAVSFGSGPVTVRVGAESVKKVGGTTGSTNGFGASLGYALSSNSSLNLNFAKMEDDKSIGVNATIGDAGVGLILDKGANGAKNTSFYAAYSLPLFGVKGATITPAISFAKGGTGSKNQTGARVRINYAF
ncbi:carbohydrate porin [Hydrogenophaga sp. RWCD_12]|uniref:carbohydrate porin n=1 Tax=Hydrogenophaga sp. RWCD_12 TaxID=3391190 RepID=UPI00398543EB